MLNDFCYLVCVLVVWLVRLWVWVIILFVIVKVCFGLKFRIFFVVVSLLVFRVELWILLEFCLLGDG